MPIGKLFQPASKHLPVTAELVSDPRARSVLLDLPRKADLKDDWRWLYTLIQIARPVRAISIGRPPLNELVALASALSDAGARQLVCLGDHIPCLPVWNHTLARAGLDWLVKFKPELDQARNEPIDLMWLTGEVNLTSLLEPGLARRALVVGRHFAGLPADFASKAARHSQYRFRLLHDSPELGGFWVLRNDELGRF